MDIDIILPLSMFAVLGVLLFSGYPVAFVLGGVGLFFGLIGYYFDFFSLIEFFNIVPRIWGGIAESLILTAIPMFILMGTALEKSGLANDLLHVLQILLRRVPGALALAVTLLGTILAATTGIIGASVVMLTMMALPVMMDRGYNTPLSVGTIAASSTLGILIPPSIMLVMMADLMAVSVGKMFIAALIPGLMLSGLYGLYIMGVGVFSPKLAPKLPSEEGADSYGLLLLMVVKSFVPPVALVLLVLGSIFAGWASPTEASGVGAAGALLLAFLNGRLSFAALKEIVERTAHTGAMIFFIFVGATAFSYVFRSLGGDDVVIGLIESYAVGPWGVLTALMIGVFILGFFFDWVEITLSVLPIFMPIIQTLNFGNHLASQDVIYWFAILVAVNLQTSFLTPPFGFALFYLKSVAPPSVRIQQVYKGIIPFVLLQLFGLAMIMMYPNIALWLPRQLQ